MGRLGRSEREARRGGATGAGSGALGRRPEMTLMSLAESITTALVNRLPDKNRLPDDGGGPALESVYAAIAFEGKRRRVELPVALFNASRDMQVGCVYGHLARLTRPEMTVCMDCGRVEQDMFVFDGATLVKVPRRRGGHGS